jgi:transcriptional regulator with XRE-family HTH domain
MLRRHLKIAILDSGLTQRQISIQCGIPETRLSAIVRNRAVPSTQEQDDLSRVLRKTPDVLFASSPQEAA